MAATWLVERTTMDLSPAYLVMAAALVSIVAVQTLRRQIP